MAYVLNSNVLRCGTGVGCGAQTLPYPGNDMRRCNECPFSGDLYDFLCELRLLKNRTVLIHVYDADLLVILLDIACDAVRALDPATGNILVIRAERILYFEESTLPAPTTL